MPIRPLLLLTALLAPDAPQVVGGRWESLLVLEDYPHRSLNLGNAALRIGDVTGDGVEDFAVAAYLDTLLRTQDGTVRVHSGTDGSMVYIVAGDKRESEFGRTLDVLQDVDGDGRPDLVVGAPRNDGDVFHVERGAVHVLSGATGFEISKSGGLAAFDHFGTSVATLGDVNLDGSEDFASGAPDADTFGFTDNGTVSVHSGATGATLFEIHGAADGERLGLVVAGIGDVDGDGLGDLAIGLPDADTAAGPDAGRIQIHSGSGGLLLRTVDGAVSSARLGSVIARLGDLDGDGRDEIGLGMPDADGPAGAGAGIAQIVSPRSAMPLAVFHGEAPGERFGAAIAGDADLDRDGVPDFVIGAPGASPGGRTGAGQANLYSGSSRLEIERFAGLRAVEALGSSIAILDDMSGDGSLEVLATSPQSNLGAGSATIFGVLPLMTVSPRELSVSAGGTVLISVDLSSTAGGAYFQILGSGRGHGSTRIGGLEVPLLPDRIFEQTLNGNYPAYCLGFSGVLSALGQAGAAILVLPGQLNPALAGREIQLAAVAHDGAGAGIHSSVAVSLRFTP